MPWPCCTGEVLPEALSELGLLGKPLTFKTVPLLQCCKWPKLKTTVVLSESSPGCMLVSELLRILPNSRSFQACSSQHLIASTNTKTHVQQRSLTAKQLLEGLARGRRMLLRASLQRCHSQSPSPVCLLRRTFGLCPKTIPESVQKHSKQSLSTFSSLDLPSASISSAHIK